MSTVEVCAGLAIALRYAVRGDALRSGAECFLRPSGATQRRYEALRAYLVDEMPAAEVADRFGYSTASVHQMATMLRTGKLRLLAEGKPGPKGPRKATGRRREQILTLRAAHHSVTEIAEALTAAGTPISAQSVWRIIDQQGLPRLPQRDDGPIGARGRSPDRAGAGTAAYVTLVVDRELR
jgi:transposase